MPNRLTYMTESLLVAFIGVLGVIVGSFATLLNTRYKYKLESKKGMSLIDKTKYSFYLKKILYCIRTNMDSDRILFARFHNGGHFIDGVSMDKFSIFQEDCYDNVEYIQDKHQSVLMSRFAGVFNKLLFEKSVIINNLDELEDSSFKNFLDVNGIKSAYLFLIEEDNGTPIGFLMIGYNSPHEISTDEVTLIQRSRSSILNCVTYKQINQLNDIS